MMNYTMNTHTLLGCNHFCPIQLVTVNLKFHFKIKFHNSSKEKLCWSVLKVFIYIGSFKTLDTISKTILGNIRCFLHQPYNKLKTSL